MLKYIYNRIFFVALTILVLLMDVYYEVPIWVYPIIYLAYISISFYGSYFIQSDFYVKAHWHGDRNKKAVALTFDDGPSKQHTDKVLEILHREKVKACFFVIGKNIQGNEELLMKMLEEEHIVGNHSYEHNFWFSMKSKESMIADTTRCNQLVFDIIGKQMNFFRPPYGVTNPWIGKVVRNAKFLCIGWSIRTYDTTAKSKDAVVRKALNGLNNGDIILLHDWAPFTIDALPEIIQGIRNRGFEILRVDELLNQQAYV
ncbi:MAG: polysaccharide deacetylase family protein [Bacteroidetes bacterium]|nr:polysaccharide deacetylase family protein [Bacteroidota bacterium]MBK8658286.1 polysaccharide deacetylase family protein [Bacteroidota bacterium]